MTGKEQKHGATAKLLSKLATEITQFLANIGLMPSPTKIHNESGETIFLIAISCASRADPVSTGKIEKKPAEKIEKGEIKLVDWSKYDRSRNIRPSEIHILFRTGSEKVDTDEYIKKMRVAWSGGNKLSPGEMLHPYYVLCQPDLYIKLDGKIVQVQDAGQGGEKNKGKQAMQTSSSLVTEIQKGSEQYLIKEVEALRMEVDGLKCQMAGLMEFLQKVASELKALSPNISSSSN